MNSVNRLSCSSSDEELCDLFTESRAVSDSEDSSFDTASISTSSSLSSSLLDGFQNQEDKYLDVEMLFSSNHPLWLSELTSNSGDNNEAAFIVNHQIISSCSVCGGPNFILNFICICDGCHTGYHQTCHTPNIADSMVSRQNANGEQWFCADCQVKDTSRKQRNMRVSNKKELSTKLGTTKREVDTHKSGVRPRAEYNGDLVRTNKMDVDESDSDTGVDDDASTCSSRDTEFYYRLLDSKDIPRAFPSTLSTSRHRKLHSKTSEIRSFFSDSSIPVTDFNQVFKPDEWIIKKKPITTTTTTTRHSQPAVKSVTRPSFYVKENTRGLTSNNVTSNAGLKTPGSITAEDPPSPVEKADAAPVKNALVTLKKSTTEPPVKSIASSARSANETSNKNCSTWIDDDDADFDILTLIPPNVIPCLSLGILSFREGTIDPKRGQIRRGRIYPVTR